MTIRFYAMHGWFCQLACCCAIEAMLVSCHGHEAGIAECDTVRDGLGVLTVYKGYKTRVGVHDAVRHKQPCLRVVVTCDLLATQVAGD